MSGWLVWVVRWVEEGGGGGGWGGRYVARVTSIKNRRVPFFCDLCVCLSPLRNTKPPTARGGHVREGGREGREGKGQQREGLGNLQRG